MSTAKDTAIVPNIDIAPFREGASAAKLRVAKRIGAACKDIGFFAVTGHGVSTHVTEALRSAAHAFFTLSLEQKMKAVHPIVGTPRGYRGFAEEALGRAVSPDAYPDLKEFYHIGRESWPNEAYYTGAEGSKYFIRNLWPDAPIGFGAAAIAYYDAMEVLVRDLMHIAALALDLPQTYFDNKIDRHVSAMRINYYPPHSDPIPSEQLRAGAHTDFGLFTILLGEDGTGGLQVRTTNGEWIDVATSPDFFVVNIGDLFMRWTNDTWVSNLHRVRNPSLRAVAPRRLSIGFFHQPNYDALIECISSCTDPNNPPRYEPVRSGDYRDHKYRQTDVTGNI